MKIRGKRHTLGTIAARDNLLFETVSSPSDTVKSGITLTDGDYNSDTVTMKAPDGAIKVDVNSMSGAVSAASCTAGFKVKEGDFNLQKLDASGDNPWPAWQKCVLTC